MTYEVKLYRYLSTSGTQFEEWRTEAPTESIDGNPVNSGTISIIEVVSENHVEASIVEETIPTGGHFQCKATGMHITSSGITTVDLSWPMPISLLSAEILIGDANCGDVIEAHVAPDTVIGALTSTAVSGSTVLNVSSTVVDNTAIGFFIKIESQDLGRVLEVGDTTITVENEVESDISGGSYVLQTIKMMTEFELCMPGRMTLGDTKVGASHFPEGTVLRYVYHSNDASSKEFVAMVEYLY